MKGFKNPTHAVCLGCNEHREMARYQKAKGGEYYHRAHCVKCWTIERNGYMAAYREKHHERLRVSDREKYRKNPEYQADVRRRYYRKLQDVVFKKYGDLCACCGEDERIFLSIDHVNNDGAAHRKEIGVGHILFRWIIENDFPNTLQLLCCNCNLGKHRNGGVCPHESRRLNYLKPDERAVTLFPKQ
jgi:hypothetical protein